MSASPNLKLPYIDANQNQKSVTHNEALRILDALVNLHVASNTLSAPPASPADGQRWIVASAGSGAWLGKDLNVAAWQDGAWSFYAPNPGFVAYVDAIGGALMWNGTAWVSLLNVVTQLALNALAIGTAIDPANPLSAKLNAALFAAVPTTASPAGTGHVRVALSKQAAGNTASLLFQDNYSGRAEIGLVGDDNFHFKVSPDGSTFYDAMVIAAAGGAVSFLASPTAPTQAQADNSTRLATTSYADRAAAANFARTQVNDAPYTVLPSDRTVAVVALTAARTLTLPAASAYPQGATLTVVDESGACSATNTLTLVRVGTDTINGAMSAVLSSAYCYLALESNGSNKWTIVDQPFDPNAWTAYTPTVAPVSGALTTYATSGRFKKLGRTVFVQFTINITTNGTAAGGLNVSLPIAAAAFNYTLAGRENSSSGKSLVSVVSAGPAANCFVANYDATYPGSNGASITLSGVYESAS